VQNAKIKKQYIGPGQRKLLLAMLDVFDISGNLADFAHKELLAI
jgi:hypothetical protein